MAKFLRVGTIILNIDEIFNIVKQRKTQMGDADGKLGLVTVGYNVVINLKNGSNSTLFFDNEAEAEKCLEQITIKLEAVIVK